MKSFIEAVSRKEKGLVTGNSLYLPFHCEILKIWIGKEMSLLASPDIIVDFCDNSHIGIREGRFYTNLVVRKWGDLQRELGGHKGHVILHAAEKGADIFKSENLHYIRISFPDNREELEFELIGNPFDL